MRKSVHYALTKFGKQTTTHGVSHVVSESSTRARFLWLLLTLSSAGMLIFQLQKIGTSYLAKSTLTSLRRSKVDSQAFPTLTFCSGSILRHSAVPGEPPLFGDPVTTQHILANENLFGIRTVHSLQYLSAFSNQQEMKMASLNPNHFFLSKLKSSCVFGIHDYCKYPANFTDFLTTSYGGLCFQLNSDGKMAQRDAGSYYGLSMIIFANQSDYIPFSTLDIGSGILLKLNQHGEFPFPEIDGIALSTGYLTRIALKRVRVERLKAPYPSNCTDGEGTFLLFPGKYTISNCKRSCLARDALRNCGTTDPLTMLILNRTKHLKYTPITPAKMKCIYDSALKSSTVDENKCICPVPCVEEYYQPIITQTKWPSKVELPYYKKAFSYALGIKEEDITDDFVHENFLQLNVFFDEMSYQKIAERKEWTNEKLVADVGGQMGVWIGASVLSIFEFGVLIVSLIRKTFCKKSKKSKVTVISVKSKEHRKLGKTEQPTIHVINKA